MPSQKKDIILYVGKIHDYILRAIRKYEKKHHTKYRIALLIDSRNAPTEKTLSRLDQKEIDILITCDTNSDVSIQKALLPFKNEILAISTHGDAGIPQLSRVVPHVPYLKTATTTSLYWATNKIWMRRRLYIHNKKITPSYTLVEDTKKSSIEKIEKKVGYPAIVKPVSLGASKLVSIVFHREELEKTLKKIFKKIDTVYKESGYSGDRNVLVEQFMEGDMYSIDGYVTSRGKVHYCPMYHIKTGRAVGFDDFFGYQQMTPTLLKKASIDAAEAVSTEAVHALGLRSTTVHVEMMKTESGWKVIELGPRVGGFRHEMYEMCFGINHTMNDIAVRIPNKVVIPKKVLGHSVAMKFFAKKEGKLVKLVGIKKAQTLQSFKRVAVNKKIGDMCRYAKNGGSSVFNIVLFNPERSKLLADIRRLEQMIKIETE